MKKYNFTNLFEGIIEHREEHISPLDNDIKKELLNSLSDYLKINNSSCNEDYLHREHRILSILREKEKKNTSFSFQEIISQYSWTSLSTKDEINDIGKYIINKSIDIVRPMLLNCIDDNNVFSISVELKKLLGDTFISQYINNLIYNTGNKSDVLYYCLKDNSKGAPFLLADKLYKTNLQYPELWSIYPLKASYSGQITYLRKSREKTICFLNDAAVLFARGILYNILSQNMLIKDILINDIKRYISRFLDNNTLIIKGSSNEELILLCDYFGYAYRFNNDDGMPYMTHLKVYMQLAGIIEPDISIFKEHIPYQKNYKIHVSPCDQVLSYSMKILVKQFHLEEEIIKFERKQSEDYALSFQTKKNIPDTILNEMKSSLFNKWFGFVEFDEDSDILKVRELAKEFEAFENQILRQGEKKLVSLRFRKLGQHKATGLYYPRYNCICVDVNNPHSFTHEYFHMIDYTNDRLSSKYDFLEIYDRYESLIIAATKNMQLSGKYNLDYYLLPTEVFARCAEIYMVRTLGINNSLVNTFISGFAYPDDDILKTDYIDTYFSNLLRKKEGVSHEESMCQN